MRRLRKTRLAAILVFAAGSCLVAASFRTRQDSSADVQIMYEIASGAPGDPPIAVWLRSTGPSIATGATEGIYSGGFYAGSGARPYWLISSAFDADHWPRCSLAPRDRYIVVPLWLPASALLSLGAYLWFAGRQHRPGYCRCGYDLTGNTSGRCPECGTPTGGGNQA